MGEVLCTLVIRKQDGNVSASKAGVSKIIDSILSRKLVWINSENGNVFGRH
jgi:hypothetical protein